MTIVQPPEDIHMHGHCASFDLGAVSGEYPDNGQNAAEHGEYCLGEIHGGYGEDALGNRKRVYLFPGSSYVQGVVSRVAMDLHDHHFQVVVLHIEDPTPADPERHQQIVLRAGDARQMAAELTYCADVVTRIDAPHPRIKRD